jgi:hypothetical protein
MGKEMVCEGCGEPLGLFLNGRCHPDALVEIFMVGSMKVPGKLIARCGECKKEFAEFAVSEIVDLEKHPKISRKLPRCSHHAEPPPK